LSYIFKWLQQSIQLPSYSIRRRRSARHGREEALGSWWENRVKKVYAYDYIWFVWEFVYKDDILMWEALIWKRVAVDKKTIIFCMNIPGVSRPNFSRRPLDPWPLLKASKHHQIDPFLPPMRRAVGSLRSYRWLTVITIYADWLLI
jgi:hypothetical protein